MGDLFPAPAVKGDLPFSCLGVSQKQQAGQSRGGLADPSPKASHQKPLGIERQGAPLLSWPRSQARALVVLRSKSFIKNKSSESIYKLRLRGRGINFGRRSRTLPSPLLGMVEGRVQAWWSQEAPAPVWGREGGGLVGRGGPRCPCATPLSPLCPVFGPAYPRGGEVQWVPCRNSKKTMETQKGAQTSGLLFKVLGAGNAPVWGGCVTLEDM